MGVLKQNPRYHVVSLRISDAERATLDAFSQQTDRSVSALMREAMVTLLRQKAEISGPAA